MIKGNTTRLHRVEIGAVPIGSTKMNKEEKRLSIQNKIDDLKKWEQDLPEGKNFQVLIEKFEELLIEIDLE